MLLIYEPVSAQSQMKTSDQFDRQTLIQDVSDSNGTSQTDGKVNATKVLKGQVTYVVPQGTGIKLKLATVPTCGLRLMDRDLDGNLYPAQLHQEITAKTTEDIYVDDNKVIPEGTVFQGKVSKILPPRRVGRPGSLVIAFDQLTTPNGHKFAFYAQANNLKPSTWKTKAKGLGIITAHAAGGAAVGALVAYQLFGMEQTISMHGYNIAGGAAGGALLATGYAIMRKGPKAVLEPGDDLNLETDADMLMPAAEEPKPRKQFANLEGVDLQVRKAKILRDGLGGHMLRLDLLIVNGSNRHLNSIDLFAEDSNGNRHPLCAGKGDEDEFLFTLSPDSMRHVILNFSLEFPKLKHDLVWLDHDGRQPCYRKLIPM